VGAGQWYYHSISDRSNSWAGVDYFEGSMVYARATLKHFTNLAQAYSGASPGDIYLYQLHGKKNGIDHVAIAVGPGNFANYYDTTLKTNYRLWSTAGSMIDQHTTDRYHAPWNWAYLTAKKKSVIDIWLIHFNS
jgi:cell wall-associated NlpC family hydrolase